MTTEVERRAVDMWIGILGQDRVWTQQNRIAAFQHATTGARRCVLAVARPGSAEEVAACVQIAAQHGIPVYPISTGNNWGYGCNTPVVDGCVVMDLSSMNRVVSMDSELGVVTLEPGVTQQQLSDYLQQRQAPFLVPVTGAGPLCSIVGNAIERGYGITPHADHFGAVTSLEAVLSDGRIYRSALADWGAPDVDASFKWGIGPYVDGLFTQSNLGIVTQMTITLARRPEQTKAFFFWVEREDDLEEAVHAVREVLQTLPGVSGSINLMNRRRVLSMIVSYPKSETPPGEAIPEPVVRRLAKAHQVTSWTGAGGLYGPAPLVREAARIVRRSIRRVTRRIVFVDAPRVRWGRRALSVMPFLRSRLGPALGAVEETLAILDGRPSEVALPLAYWKGTARPAEGRPMNPQRDGCGLLWYAPLVPMRPALVRAYATMVEEVAIAHGMEPLITLTSLDERCFDSTVPIVFDRSNEAETERALACQRALLDAGRKLGVLPYRVATHGMGDLVDPSQPAWRMVGTIKQALDPKGIIAPGRYAPVEAGVGDEGATG